MTIEKEPQKLKFTEWLKRPEIKDKTKEKLQDFNDSLETISETERENFKKRLDILDTRGDYVAMRRADFTVENLPKNILKPRALLFDAFVKPDPESLRFTVDFGTNKTAYFKLGLGELLPDNCGVVRVYKKNDPNKPIEAERRWNPFTGRRGYYQREALTQKPPHYIYVPIYSGDRFEIEQEGVSKRDFRSEMKDQVETYNPGGKNAFALEESEKDVDDIAAENHANRFELRDEIQQSRMVTSVKNGINQPNLTPHQQDENPQKNLSNRSYKPKSIEHEPSLEIRKRIVRAAYLAVGNRQKYHKDFRRNTDLQKGRLGCAWVASDILIMAGVLKHKEQRVVDVKNKLLALGFRPARPGESYIGGVVIYAKQPGRSNGKGGWVEGHGHVGIVTGENSVVDNNYAWDTSLPESQRVSRGPDERPLFRGRDIDMILVPPDEVFVTRQETGKGGLTNERTYRLGTITSKYESADAGYASVSSGKDDPGGASYGKYQLASKTGSLQAFLGKSGYHSHFVNLEPGSWDFNAKWKELAKTDEAFNRAQDRYIINAHYKPLIEGLIRKGIDLTKRGIAVQELLLSISVQHGKALTIILNSLNNKDLTSMTDKEIITAIFSERAAYVNSLKSLSTSMKQALINRYRSEQRDLLQLGTKY